MLTASPDALLLCPITPTSGSYLTVISTNHRWFRVYGVEIWSPANYKQGLEQVLRLKSEGRPFTLQ